MLLNIFTGDNTSTPKPAKLTFAEKQRILREQKRQNRGGKRKFDENDSSSSAGVPGSSERGITSPLPQRKKYQPHQTKVKTYNVDEPEQIEVTPAAVTSTGPTPPSQMEKKVVENVLPKVVRKEAGTLSLPERKKVGSDAKKKVLAKTGFEALGLDKSITDHLKSVGYTVPTRVQESAIPEILRRQDTLVKSHTGSGKTLAYLLPVLHDFVYRPNRLTRDAGTHAIVVSPTRELAVQIDTVFKEITKPFHWLVSTTILGGENKKAEKSRLRKGAQLVIGTPGRLLDHMETTQAWSLQNIRWFILDEADRLMDLGFSQSMRKIYHFIDVVANTQRTIRCNVLVSATLKAGDDVDTLAKDILRNPSYVGFDDTDKNVDALIDKKKKKERTDGDDSSSSSSSSSDSDSDSSSDSDSEDDEEISTKSATSSKKLASKKDDVYITPTSLRQLYVEMSSRHRLVALGSFLRLRVTTAALTNKKCKIIVFVSTCASVEFLYKLFNHTFWPDMESITTSSIQDTDVMGSKPTSGTNRTPLIDTQLWKLHGNMPQKIRTETFQQFGKSDEGILICTDVAARGLDLPAVDWIIQYDAPEDTQDYVHRVGRTARIGHKGDAILFLVESEIGYLDILKSKGIDLEKVPLEKVLSGLHIGIDKNSIKPVYNANGRLLPAGAILQKQLETMVQISPILGSLAKEAYISFFRSYAAYPKELKHIFHPKRLHFGEVAHSFGLIDKPTDIGKKAVETHQETMATINPAQADKLEQERLRNKPKTLNQLARASGRKADLQEFL